MIELTKEIDSHTKGKRKIANVIWLYDIGASIFTTLLISYFVYDLNKSRFEYAGFLALGGTAALFSFLLKGGGKPSKVSTFAARIFIGVYMLFEVFSLAASYMSASNGIRLDQQRAIKSNSSMQVANLRNDISFIKGATGISSAAKVYRISEANSKISALASSSNAIIAGNEEAFFQTVGGAVGISNFAALYKTMLSALLILGTSIMLRNRDNYWCDLSLNIHLDQSTRTRQKIARWTAENKNTSTTGVKKSGSGGDTATGEDKVKADYKAALVWVKQWEHDQVFKAPQLRQSMTSTKRTQQNIVVQLLIKNGEIKRKKNGTAYEYRRV